MTPCKPIEFRGSALDDLRSFPEEARREAGYQLDKVQHGEEAVYVLHCFKKKSQRTAKADLDLASKRFRELLKETGS